MDEEGSDSSSGSSSSSESLAPFDVTVRHIGAPCFSPQESVTDNKDSMLTEEMVAEELIKQRLLSEELPFALRKVLKLLDQIKKEIEPSGGGALIDPSPLVTKLTPSVSSSSLTSVGATSNSSSSASRKRPSPLMFLRGSSKAKQPQHEQDSRSVVEQGSNFPKDIGLHMSHKHATRPQTSPGPGSISGSSSIVSHSLRHLSSFHQKKGFHIVPGSASSSAAPSMSYSPSSNTWMDVSLHMDGFFVRQAQIDLKLHKHSKNLITRSANSTHTFHTQLSQPQNPWVLGQVKTVYEHTVKHMEKIQDLLNNMQGNPTISGNDPVSTTPLDTVQAQVYLHSLICSLIASRNAMSDPNKNHFPSVLRVPSESTGCHFTPVPPKELLIEFAVHLDELIVSAYELHYLSSPREPSQVTDTLVPIYDYTHKVFRFKEIGKSVEVVDQVQVHFKVHSLQWVLENIFEAYNTAIRLLRKFESLNRHSVGCKLQESEIDRDEAARLQALADVVKKHSVLPQVHYSNWIAD